MAIKRTNRDTQSDEDNPLQRVRTRTRPLSGGGDSSALEAVPAPGDQEIAPAAAETEYDVGYCKPPHHSQFKPGQSGNPKGRPKAAKGLNSIVRETLTKKVTVRTPSGTKKISRIEAVLQKTVEQAMKGNPRALAELIKLYANAVPEALHDTTESGHDGDLTATDLAVLSELQAMFASGQEVQP
ncbi:hypothetical protein GRI89_17510 [Altererythrobacter salegens]|uniref:DUF5681 domain-containing protein n=1 Tax=Croceibacterium salegens TaxID=1737568 RepID=A0A6I4SZ75_9SPHN|nr:DUF5681 domain-containing protein [Croceibacterium salegens]MXO61344.1 hypothetical protein [Croceibacterium salegens]